MLHGRSSTLVVDMFCLYHFLNAVRPHVSYLPKSITVRSGGSFRVECASWGYETPSIAWYRDGRRLTSRSPMLTSLHAVNFQSVVDDDDDDLGIRLSLSPNADGQPDGVLRIRDVRGADRATFNCSATNANGSASRSTLLRVRGETARRPIEVECRGRREVLLFSSGCCLHDMCPLHTDVIVKWGAK